MRDIQTGAVILPAVCFIITLPGWVTGLAGWPIVHHWSWLLVARGAAIFWLGLMCLALILMLLKLVGNSPLEDMGYGRGERYGDY